VPAFLPLHLDPPTPSKSLFNPLIPQNMHVSAALLRVQSSPCHAPGSQEPNFAVTTGFGAHIAGRPPHPVGSALKQCAGNCRPESSARHQNSNLQPTKAMRSPRS
jgi:hypothetical protein